MANLILYHRTAEKIVSPSFGLGNEKHDYGTTISLAQKL
jgi:hypothetical protein